MSTGRAVKQDRRVADWARRPAAERAAILEAAAGLAHQRAELAAEHGERAVVEVLV